jgi:hypothetical protein
MTEKLETDAANVRQDYATTKARTKRLFLCQIPFFSLAIGRENGTCEVKDKFNKFNKCKKRLGLQLFGGG